MKRFLLILAALFIGGGTLLTVPGEDTEVIHRGHGGIYGGDLPKSHRAEWSGNAVRIMGGVSLLFGVVFLVEGIRLHPKVKVPRLDGDPGG